MRKKKSMNPHRVAWARDLWERAAEATKGLRLLYPDRSSAIAARFAFYTARNINREEMKEFYEEGSPDWGTSPWDPFRLTIEVDPSEVDPESGRARWVLIISRHADAPNSHLTIEEL